MIKYEGIKMVNGYAYLCFSNDRHEKVEIPIETQVSERIAKYLSKIAPGAAPVERGNVEESSSEDEETGR